MRPWLLGLLLPACATLEPPEISKTAASALQRLDNQGDQEAIQFLSAYLQIDTSNPPGNETAGANFLAQFLEKEQIPSKIYEIAPGRGSLIARLPSSGARGGPLCLLSHIDVVPANPAEWTHPPFSGHVEDGMIWGRGALDMKSMGAIEALTLAWLRRLQIPLARDVILIAVSDEEDQNLGMIDLTRNHWDELGCEYMLNEGGLAIRDLLFTGQTVFPISVAEKGVLWLDMTVHGEGGHGSTPRVEHAPLRFAEVLHRFVRREPKPQIHRSLYTLLDRVGKHRGLPASWALGSPWVIDTLLTGLFLDNPATRAAITNTVFVTGIESGHHGHNVVPSTVDARLDCRLLPGTSSRELLHEVQTIAGPNASFRVRFAAEALESPQDDPVFDTLVRHAEFGRPSLVAGPALSPGFTDSLYARQRGTKAYGFVPFEITQELAKGYHAANERLSTEELIRGLKTLFGAVVEIAGAP